MNDEAQEWRSWSAFEAGRYEAALEAINGAMGAYSALIARERSKDTLDEQVIERARQGRRECVRRRGEIDPANPEQVAQVRAEFTELTETVRRQ